MAARWSWVGCNRKKQVPMFFPDEKKNKLISKLSEHIHGALLCLLPSSADSLIGAKQRCCVPSAWRQAACFRDKDNECVGWCLPGPNPAIWANSTMLGRCIMGKMVESWANKTVCPWAGGVLLTLAFSCVVLRSVQWSERVLCLCRREWT